MARRIIINGEDLDLFHEEKISFNLRVNSIADISNRNSSNSNSILIPRTGKNQRLLGMTGTIGNNSNVPYSSQRVDYIIQGTYIVVQGYLQVIDTLKDRYRIAIFDGIIDFAGLLGNKVISDLDFTPENHLLDFATVESSFSNTEGYIYGLANWGKRDTFTSNDMASHGCSVYAHTVWDRIFTEAGLTYVGDFFTLNTDWLELVLPATRGITTIESAAGSTDQGDGDTDSIADSTNYMTYINQHYTHAVTANTFSAEFTVNGSGEIVVTNTGTIELNYTIAYTQTNTRVRWRTQLNGNTKRTLDLPYLVTDSPQTGSLTMEVTAGDIITFTLSVDNPTPQYPFDPATYFTHVFTTSTNVQINTISGGSLVTVQDYMSTELTQKDFVKDILQRYGLVMIRERENINQYQFISMEDLLDTRENSRDWTTKLTRVDKESYQSGYAQNNLGDYSYESGEASTKGGILVVNNDNAAYEKTIITAPYTVPTQSVYNLNNIKLLNIPIWEYNEDDLVYDNVETAPRLLRVVKDSFDLAMKIFDSANTTVTVDIPYLSLTDMDYQYFFNTYYANLNDLLNFYKAISVTLDLDIVDFKQVDFGRLIFFRQTGRYYYLDTVKIRENGATAKLIEIRNFNA
jgi:hypothetical protein